MVKKSRVKKSQEKQIQDRVFLDLQSKFHVTGKELVSGSFYYGDGNVLVEDVIPFFECEYGVSLKDKHFNNWTEFAESIGLEISDKKKNRKQFQ